MEIEIKLSPVEPSRASQVFGDELLSPFLGDVRRSDMESTYYKDEKGLLDAARASLRLRRENGEGVCCVKIKSESQGAAAVRQEYEVKAETVQEGASLLSQLPEMPPDARAALEGGDFYAVCGCTFTRTEADYDAEDIAFVLSYDIGEYHKGDLRAPLGELELELKKGSADRLNEICAALVERHGLTVCHTSKYKRAMSLEEPQLEAEQL